MPWIFPIKLVSEANQSGGKSTIIRPLIGIGILCITACIVCFIFNVPYWIGTVFALFGFIIIGVSIYAYIYCLKHDRDALRSEWFSISKKAIEHGVFGDSTTGMISDNNTNIVAGRQNDRPSINE